MTWQGLRFGIQRYEIHGASKNATGLPNAIRMSTGEASAGFAVTWTGDIVGTTRKSDEAHRSCVRRLVHQESSCHPILHRPSPAGKIRFVLRGEDCREMGWDGVHSPSRVIVIKTRSGAVISRGSNFRCERILVSRRASGEVSSLLVCCQRDTCRLGERSSAALRLNTTTGNATS